MSSLDEFYQKNRNQLESFYPGIQLRILKEHYERFCSLNKKEEIFFNGLIEGKPLEYILGKAFFYNIELDLSDCALIPRFETEILLEKALAFITNSEKKNLKIADIGTGPGTILLALSKESRTPFEGIGVDIDKDCIELAKKNYMKLKPSFSAQIDLFFEVGDRLGNKKKKFDLIVSNPPYIKKRADREKVHSQVLKYEPATALFLEDDSYEEWFSLFFKQVHSCLCPDGLFLMEGHEDHLEKLIPFAKDQGLELNELINDLTNKPRILSLGKQNG
jgi:release factor glutamine methyltransferase